MSLNYYLFCRNSYDKIIKELDYIISTLEEIDVYKEEEEEEAQTNPDIILANQHHDKLFFSSRKQHMQLLRDTYNKIIETMCNHTFIKDTIDISPDRTQNIRYCSICEYTDPNY